MTTKTVVIRSWQKMIVAGAKMVGEEKGWIPEIPKVCMKRQRAAAGF